MDHESIAGNRYHVTTSDETVKIVDVTKVSTTGQYQIVSNGIMGNHYDAQVTQAPVPTRVSGGTRHKKKRFRSKTQRIKPASNVKRR